MSSLMEGRRRSISRVLFKLGVVFGLILLISSCSNKKKNSSHHNPVDTIELTVGIPLTPEQAAMLEGVRAGVRAAIGLGGTEGVRTDTQGGVRAGTQEGVRAGTQPGVRAAAGDEILADVYWDDEVVTEGIRAGVRAGVRTGVRAGVRAAGGPLGLPGSPPRRRGEWSVASGAQRFPSPQVRQQSDAAGEGEGGGSPEDLALGIELTFYLPRASASDGVHNLRTRVRLGAPSAAESTLIEVKTTVRIKVASPSVAEPPDSAGSVPFEIEIEDTPLTFSDVVLPDVDGDGISTLVEIATTLALSAVEGQASTGSARSALEQALQIAQNPAQKPTEAEAQAVSETLAQNLQKTLADQGEKTTVEVKAIDLTPPDTALSAVSGQLSVVGGQSIREGKEITFTFTCNEAFCTFHCSLDGSEFTHCTSPYTLRLSPAVHTLTVRAADGLGNTDLSPAHITFTVAPSLSPADPLLLGETVQMTVSPSGGTVTADAGNVSLFFPPGAVSDVMTLSVTKVDPAASSVTPGALTAVFDFGPSGTVFKVPIEMSLSYNDGNLQTTVREDQLVLGTEVGGTWQPVPGSKAEVSVNRVKGPVTHFSRFTVIADTTPPVAPNASLITLKMNPPGQDDTLSGAAGTVEANARVSAYADGLLTVMIGFTLAQSDGSFSAFPIGDNKADAESKIYLVATDGAGNTSSPSTMANDITVPDTTITQTPLPITNSTSASFGFTSPDASAVFECELDAAGFSPCVSPRDYTLLNEGAHTFRVRAKDAAGNFDASPATHTWTIDTTAPVTTLGSTPSTPTASTSATFTFSSTDTTATFECSLDSAAYATCTSPVNLSGLAAGSHTYSIRAKDPAGNTGSASHTWTIDLTAPTFGGLVSATAVSATQINLSWTAATDSVTAASNIVYKICRSTLIAGTCQTSFTTLFTTSAGAINYTDTTGLAAGTRFYYVVRPVDEAGNSDTNTTEKSASTWSTGVTQAVTTHIGDHTCSLLSDGTVKCWGANSAGQLGNGTAVDRLTPVAVSSLTGSVAVAEGNFHTCSLPSDGTVKCWGQNAYGQFGDGTTVDTSIPVAVSSLIGSVAMAGGFYHTCSLFSDGTVKCSGYNLNGQLGDGSTVDKLTPVAVSSLTGSVAVAAGQYHTCSLLSDGTVKCWGLNDSGQLGDGTTANKLTPVAVSSLTGSVAVAAVGEGHTCSLLSDGTVKCWGLNGVGQLGDGTAANKLTPVAVSSLTGSVAVSGGTYHTCSLHSDGTVKCWGYNLNGQLGDGTTANKLTPVAVSSLTGSVAISGGNSHTCSLLSDGTVKCWGYNLNGQLGDGTTADKPTPVAVSMPAGPMGVKLPRLHESTASGAPARPFREGLQASGSHTCALVSNGTVKCWGSNTSGQLGDGTAVNKSTPVSVSTLTNAVAVTGGESHTCSLLSDGTVKCWGYNGSGQLGDGTTADKSTPVAVSSLSGSVAVAGGPSHTCSLLSDGTVKCWGNNDSGQLGDGTTADKSTPIPVSTLTNAVAVTGGGHHTCALASDGSVKCWGFNDKGQLGDGTLVNKSTPVSVSTLTNAVAVTGGGLSAASHTCALVSDGSVKCWGRNSMGQLGDGTTVIIKSTPVSVSTLTNAVAVTAGRYYTCALVSDGSVKCWGWNSMGQLGDGTTVRKLTPVSVSTLTNAVAVTGGGDHTCALASDGTVKCWGSNVSGQLGDGTTANSLTPVPVTNLP